MKKILILISLLGFALITNAQNKKISQLPTATNLNSSFVPIIQDSSGQYVNRKFAGTNILTTGNNGLTSSSGTVSLGGTLLNNTTLELTNKSFGLSKTGLSATFGGSGSNSISFTNTLSGEGTEFHLIPNSSEIFLKAGISSPNNVVISKNALSTNKQIRFTTTNGALISDGKISIVPSDNYNIELSTSGVGEIRLHSDSEISFNSPSFTFQDYLEEGILTVLPLAYFNKPAEYFFDLSAEYTNRTLTDKQYVDNVVSDIRLKTNIKPINKALTNINRLKPVSFSFKKTPDKNDVGFIAQDFEEVFPDAVTEKGNGTKQIRKDYLEPYLVKAIQEMSDEINTLRKRVDELEKNQKRKK